MIYSPEVHQKLVDRLNRPFRRFKINPNTLTVLYRQMVRHPADEARVVVRYEYVDLDFRLRQRTTTTVVRHIGRFLENRLPVSERGPMLQVASTQLADVLYAIEQQAAVLLTNEDVYISDVASGTFWLNAHALSLGWFGSIRLAYEEM